MKTRMLFLIAFLSLASCATLSVEDYAREHDEKPAITKIKKVPAVVFDFVTLPFQIAWFAHMLNHH